MRKTRYVGLAVGIVVAISVGYLMLSRQTNTPTNQQPSQQNTSENDAPQEQNQPATFDKNQYSLTDPSSPWVVVNKKRPLPDGYTPADLTNGQLRSEAYTHLNELRAAARSSGHTLSILSAYRSQATQATTYGGYVTKDGVAVADTYSARPRYSEHQTGLAADLGNGVCNLEICFGATPAGQWLSNNAHLYGFIIRYPKDKQSVTGYQYEPWHVRYVGKELAQELSRSGQTMEEYFGLEPAAQY